MCVSRGAMIFCFASLKICCAWKKKREREKGRKGEENGKIQRKITGKQEEKENEGKIEAEFQAHWNIELQFLPDLYDIPSMKRTYIHAQGLICALGLRPWA